MNRMLLRKEEESEYGLSSSTPVIVLSDVWARKSMNNIPTTKRKNDDSGTVTRRFESKVNNPYKHLMASNYHLAI